MKPSRQPIPDLPSNGSAVSLPRAGRALFIALALTAMPGLSDVAVAEAATAEKATVEKPTAGKDATEETTTTAEEDDVNLCEGLFTGQDRVRIPAVARPPYLRYYKDPAFGTRVMRITDADTGEVFKPPYSTMQAFNADESLLLLYRTGNGRSGHVLLDGTTYELVRELDILPADLEEVFWSFNDPDTFFYVSKHPSDFGEFKRYSVSKDRSETITDFHDVCGCDTGDKHFKMFTYRISTDEVIEHPLREEDGWQTWTAPQAAPSGRQLWFQGKVLDTDLETVKVEHDMSKPFEHANIGLTHDGRDTMYTTVFDPSPNGCDDDLWGGVGHLVAFDMDTGACRPIIAEGDGWPYTTSGTHVSARAHKRPGWVAMSSIGYDSFDFFTNGRKAPAFLSEIYLTNTDPENHVVCRLAHHRSYGKSAEHGGYNAYFGEPHATISPSGTRIVFGSDWYDSGSVDTYVIELPAYKPPEKH
ncbi:MAG: hypothetical protein CSB44_12935 [Gammaproteobacteria bacterium]|nr:MAG: hypothetical protein CSB44_12935 [Gammaproteobacteria bacterium]